MASWLPICSFDEKFRMTALDSGFRSNYNIEADNDLYGIQFGGLYGQSLWCYALALKVGAKAGIYGNDARQRFLLRDVDNTFVTRNFRNRDGTVASVGEIDANITGQVMQCLAARIGYQLMW